ncbi:MAG: hypothetical protein HFG16_07850 [Erysipelotrichaceae bacterium]|nr:hypothetical protein [Erysipelotrichaceae bacterium]
MYETAQKYTEHSYYAKEQIADEIDSYLLEPIWQEVKTYRSFFRYDLKIGDKPLYLTRNPLTVNRILQMEEMLRTYERNCKEEMDVYCPYLDSEQNERYRRYVMHLHVNDNVQKEEYFTAFFHQFAIQDVWKPHLLFLLKEEEPFLLRYFSLAIHLSRRTRALLMIPFLLMEHRLYIKDILSIVDYADTYAEDINGDITYAFLDMLEQLRLILYKKMILLNNTAKDLYKVLQEQELLERHPELKKEQICFYVSHRELGHYYTIQNYIQHAKVCYETARQSLDQLVDKRWYEKKKIGKKFVYFIV